MSYFSAIISWLLMSILITSQAAPMVTNTADQPGQEKPQPPNMPTITPPDLPPVALPQPQSTVTQPVQQSKLVQSANTVSATTPSSQSQLPQCPPDTQPCPTSAPPKPEDTATQPPKEQNQEVKTGWWNAANNIAKIMYHSFNEFFVGKKGILTNLQVTFGSSQPEKNKIKKSNSGSARRSNGGNIKGCCVFIRGKPQVYGDDDDDQEKRQETEEDKETKHQTNVNVPSVNLSYVSVKSNKQSSAATPGVPGAITDTDAASSSVNCCCVGPTKCILTKLFKFIIHGKFNCCTAEVTVTGVQTN